jgi:OTT_1508-like deaminase
LIRYVDQNYLRADGELLEKPAFDDNETWEGLRKMLKGASTAIMALLDGKRPISMGGSLESYLRKILSITADIKNMARAAVSPQCKDIFDKIPNIVGLPGEYREINTFKFPRSPDQWELAMERPMSYYNQLPHVSSRRVMDMTVISRDCFTIAQLQHHRSAPVHCEVKLLLHLFAEEQQSTNPKPPAYSYIGLSKLSCLGCFNFLLAFNEVFGTRFVTKGTHSKAYFPWGFPESYAEHDQLVNQVYMRLTNHLVPWYNGYVPENVPLAPD